MRASLQFFADQIKCVEVGVGAGVNAIEMLNGFPFGKFYLVDSYDINNSTFQFGRVFTLEERSDFIRSLNEKLQPFGERVKLLVLDSDKAARRFPDEYFDFVYIDAQHDFDSVIRDLRAWWPKLKPGGVISGHDAGIDGVKRAITEFFFEGLINYKIEDWWVIK